MRIGLVLEVQIFREFGSLLKMNRLTLFRRLKSIHRGMILKLGVILGEMRISLGKIRVNWREIRVNWGEIRVNQSQVRVNGVK